MANVINQARLKQRSLVVTLLDLKNAFGEVHHNLIPEILKYHHIPDHIRQLILSLYSNFQTSILTSTFQTPFITVGRGVLQGDCLGPLTFNLCFNKFIRYISDHKFKQFGFTISSLNPIHWFQFADDAAVITGLQNENQFLLNHFTRWWIPPESLNIYHRYVLSKLSWHLTIADLSKTWVIQNLDNVVARYTRHWLELPISSTLSTFILQNSNMELTWLYLLRNLSSARLLSEMLLNLLLTLISVHYGLQLVMVQIYSMTNIEILNKF